MKFLTGLLGVMSGSMGGVTASHNRFGQYLRTRVTPVNPNTDRQQGVRSVFQALSNDWTNSLNAAERAAWNLYASIVVVKDAMGQDIYLTGYNHFLRSNCVALGGSVAQVDSGPTIFTLADSDETMTGTVDEAGQEISVAFNDALPWLDEDEALMQISMSRPANAGVDFVPPVSRIAGYLLGDSITPLTTPQVLDCPFGVAEGQKVIVTGRILRADGRLSGKFLNGSTVTA